jgi:RHS repeat-associated protein
LNTSGDITVRYLTGQDGELYSRDVVGDYGSEATTWPGMQTAWLIQDRQGSIDAVLSADGSTVLDALSYDGYGNIISETDAAQRGAFAFTGLPFNSSTGLMHAQNRDYDTADPSGLGPDLTDRRYCGNNPTDETDPTGLSGNPDSLLAGSGSDQLHEALALQLEFARVQQTIQNLIDNPPGQSNTGGGSTQGNAIQDSNIAPARLSLIPNTIYIIPDMVGVSGQLVRWDTFDPMKTGFSASDPFAPTSAAEHATGKHIRWMNGRSPFISASGNQLGSPGYEVGSKSYWIDIEKFKKAGGVILSNEQLELEIAKAVTEGKLSAESARIWLRSQEGTIGIPGENEMLLKAKGGIILPDMISYMSLTSRNLIRVGKGAGAIGLLKSAYDMGGAIAESEQKQSIKPVVNQSIKTAGGFAGAWVGAKAGGGICFFASIETGPFSILIGFGGMVVGGTAGFMGASWLLGE